VKLIHGVHEDAMLVVHGLDTDRTRVTPSQKGHNASWNCYRAYRQKQAGPIPIPWHPGATGEACRTYSVEEDRGRGVVAAGSEDDRRTEDERAAHPGKRAEVFAEHADAEIGSERRLNVEEDAGTRSGNVVDAPIP